MLGSNRALALAESKTEAITQAGMEVRFRVEDVFWPNHESVFAPLPPETEVKGVIVGFSDSGPRPQAFAVVEVVRTQTLIVPVEKLQTHRTS
jgi:hypothetical protein